MTAPTLIEQLRDAAATGRSLIHADVLMERAADALAAGANILAARDAEVARLRALVDVMRPFFERHGLGSKLAPSCLCCGRSTQNLSIAIRHMELPDIVVCVECRDRAALAQPKEPT
jgi:hypothetical protein